LPSTHFAAVISGGQAAIPTLRPAGDESAASDKKINHPASCAQHTFRSGYLRRPGRKSQAIRLPAKKPRFRPQPATKAPSATKKLIIQSLAAKAFLLYS
jgi:hypothetical protein